ncbi:MAG: T9SS type A sorting domain-containing protein, partial [Candidatus Cloacimonetes bacterium]|nr:T9SS type A sorting domain-containing protein [Candidatus Cloacimonadota bacterium]
NGEIQWFPNGFVICDAIKNQKKPMAVTGGEYTYVIFEDTRSSGKTDIYNIYAQKVKFDSVDVDDYEIHHEDYALNQNYPNPFKSSTAISFNLNPNTLKDATVKIYNIKGQQVKTLECPDNIGIIAEATESLHHITWDGIDNNGKAVSSGIYFYRLEADDYKSKPRKMVLLK